MADIAEIKELAKTLNLMNVYKGVIDISDETVSNLDYLYNILKQEVDIRKDNKTTSILKASRLPKKEFDDSGITQGLKWQLREIEKIVKNLGKPVKEKKEKDKTLEFIYKDIEEQLKQRLSTKVCVNSKGNGSGKIEIDFYNHDDLERLLEVLSR